MIIFTRNLIYTGSLFSNTFHEIFSRLEVSILLDGNNGLTPYNYYNYYVLTDNIIITKVFSENACA